VEDVAFFLTWIIALTKQQAMFFSPRQPVDALGYQDANIAALGKQNVP
jgi:hypothetical protein